MSKTMSEQNRELSHVSNKFTWLFQPSGSSCKRATAIADIVYFSVPMFQKKSFMGFYCSFLCLGPTSKSFLDFHCCLTCDLPYIASILFTDGKLQLKCTLSEKTPAGSQAIVKKKIICCCCCCCRCSRSYFAM